MTQRILYTALLAVTVLAGCKSKKQEVQPQIKQLTDAVYASGTLVPENEYKVVSAAEGFLRQSLVKEGDTVRKGQLLFTLGSDMQQAQVATATGLVLKTRPVTAPDAPQVRDLQTRLEMAQTRLQNDELQYHRYKNLFDQQAISASAYEKYQLQYQSSQNDVKSLQEQLGQQRLASELQLQQANNQLQIARTGRQDGLLRSYTNGVVYDVYKQTGDLVGVNQPLALVGSGQMIAKLLVDEDDLAKVFAGQAVLITMDAYPNKVFHARITKIYPLLNKQEQSFRVDARFEDVLPQQLYGLNIEANIVLHEKEKVMVIPRKALLPGDSVLVKENGTTARVKIQKGASDNEYVQVTGGLNPSSVLIIEL
ncbi:MAG TPA: efflux RND transporter periplasmic adaptor subunit [Chitinophagaceae bacterium]|nr:efflux RND transporter periplasmic adaptor subunit [Chitinophagaceae bacterium]